MHEMKQPRPKRVLYASHWWLEALMGAVAHQAANYGWHLNFEMCLTGELPQHWKGDGILTTFSGDIDRMKRFLSAANCPTVSLNQNFPEIKVPRVDIDMTAVGALAATHFLERGFRSFAVYTPHTWHASRLAHAAFEQAVAEAGHTMHKLIWQRRRNRAPDSWPDRFRWLCRQLRNLPKPVAVLAVEVECPAQVLEACMAESLAVPDAVAVLGCLDMPVFRQATVIPTSNILVDYAAQAREACTLLQRMMAGEPVPTENIHLQPAGIITRRSTDTIAAQTPEVTKAIRFMLDHYAGPIGVPDAVRVSGLSRSGLYYAFESDLGASPGVILTRIRIDQAKRMLRETGEKIASISERCGFGAPVNMSRHFRDKLAMSPSAYRKQATQQGSAL